MGRLILHIGTHKTGTTSIQRFLAANRAALSARGVDYPGYALIGQPDHYAHLGLFNGFAGEGEQFPEDRVRAFMDAVRARMADHDLTVLSAEPLYRHVRRAGYHEPVPEAPEAYWPAREAHIARVAELVGDAQVVVVFRQQADFAQSLYQEHVKATRHHGDFADFLKRQWYHFAFLQQAEAWERAFPGLDALSFEHLKAGGDLVGAFCARLGIDDAGLARPERQNEGLPVDLVVLKRMLHGTRTTRADIRARIDALAAHLEVDPEMRAHMKRRCFFASGERMGRFQRRFREDNAALAERFLRNLPEPGAAPFPVPRPAKPRIFGDRLSGRVTDRLTRLALEGIEARG